MENVLQELFWTHFFGRSYRSNGSKIHLDVALPNVILKKIFLKYFNEMNNKKPSTT